MIIGTSVSIGGFSDILLLSPANTMFRMNVVGFAALASKPPPFSQHCQPPVPIYTSAA